MLLNALLHKTKPLAQAPFAPGEGEKAQVSVQPVRGLQLVERGQELARGEVAGGAEDDEITGSEISHRTYVLRNRLFRESPLPLRERDRVRGVIAFMPSILTLLGRMSAEAPAHHGQQLVGVFVLALARKTHHEREAHDRRRHALLDALERGPAALARVGHERRDVLQLLIAREEFGGEIEP